MDIKFDALAAKSLIYHMDKYCGNISREARSLRSLMKIDRNWDDSQSQAFKANIDSIALDLNQVMQIENEYMKVFDQKVKELRG